MKRSTLETILKYLPIASKDVTRKHLNGVHIASDGTKVILSVTDGHRCIQTTIADAIPSGEYMLGFDSKVILAHLLKTNKYREEFDTELSKNRLIVDALSIPQYTEEFPNLNEVKPVNRQHRATITLNAQYLLELAKALGESKTPSVTLSFDPTNAGAPVEILNEHDGFALVMPMRTDVAFRQAEVNAAIFNKETA